MLDLKPATSVLSFAETLYQQQQQEESELFTLIIHHPFQIHVVGVLPNHLLQLLFRSLRHFTKVVEPADAPPPHPLTSANINFND
ncbi:hypothetical protein [Saccharococcus thermophilus]|uniref:hypothetical protein n=1 Tax=Saccharococcus thermophilus TaxID=29396 RepID=UPI0036D25825